MFTTHRFTTFHSNNIPGFNGDFIVLTGIQVYNFDTGPCLGPDTAACVLPYYPSGILCLFVNSVTFGLKDLFLQLTFITYDPPLVQNLVWTQ